ncbi:MAG: hypothetical protein ACLGIR_02665 [Actinomycetes bacterium]
MQPSRALRVLLAALVLAAGLAAAPAPTPAGPLDDPCRELGAPERACRTVQVVAEGLAQTCRVAAADGTCATLDGDPIDPAEVAAFAAGPVAESLRLQSRLGDVLPLRDAVFVSTHNSFNAAAYTPSLAGLDPNQRHTMHAQLELGARGLELDLVTGPNPATGRQEPLLCHSVCSVNDRPLAEGLEEIARWLEANPDEVLVIDVQDGISGAAQYDLAAAAFEAVLGDLLVRPSTPCAPIPLETSRDDIRASGARVLVYAGCGAGAAWGAVAHSSSPRSQSKADGFEGFPACREGDAASRYATRWTRHWEDTTWLAAMAGTTGVLIDDRVAREMTDCGLNMPSLDRLVPDDTRYDDLLWSWSVDGPGTEGDCAVLGTDRGFGATGCDEPLPVACRDASGRWTVLRTSSAQADAADACTAAGAGRFDVPRSGWEAVQARLARDAAGVDGPVRLAYTRDAGEWTPVSR